MKEIPAIHQLSLLHGRTWSFRKIPSRSFYGFLFLLLASNTHCKKSAPPPNILPPVTQEGKNTFGCKVNGDVWTPYFQCTVFTGICKELGISVYHADTIHQLPLAFTLSTRRLISDSTLSTFDLFTPEATIAKTGNIIDSAVILYSSGGSVDYYRNTPGNTSGILNISKLDTVNRIIAGTFSFTLYNTWNDSVVVTDGRFDLKYDACLCH
jgi:hypothetical protein